MFAGTASGFPTGGGNDALAVLCESGQFVDAPGALFQGAAISAALEVGDRTAAQLNTACRMARPRCLAMPPSVSNTESMRERTAGVRHGRGHPVAV